jgi:peptidyl-prolyl cis-trans isomerase A (cyclophilin A)
MTLIRSSRQEGGARSDLITHAAAFGLVAAFMASGTPAAGPEEGKGWKAEAGLYAVLDTTEGRIVCKLFDKTAPKTVENFVGLAEGTKEFKDPVAGVQAKRPYFNDTKFHRVIPGFMMQGGDPTGTGQRGPGYTIPDEFSADVKFDKPGRLAMANVGRPNTGGSQFFITQVPTAWLNGKHTIFGQVVEGQDVVNKVCGSLGTKSGKPTKEIILKTVTIERVGGSK